MGRQSEISHLGTSKPKRGKYDKKENPGGFRIPGFKRLCAIVQSKWPNSDFEIIIRKKYRKRSTQQNKFYWVAVIPAMAKCMEDLMGEPVSREDAHNTLQGMFSYDEVVELTDQNETVAITDKWVTRKVDPDTGEMYIEDHEGNQVPLTTNEGATIIRIIRSTTKMDKMQFSEYLDNCIKFIKEEFGWDIDYVPPID